MGLFDIFTNTNANDAANAQIEGLNTAYKSASGDINQGLTQGNAALTTNYTSALAPFLSNISTASGGVKALTDALGITGDPSQVTARLQQTPGYQFQLQQGNENVLRNASRTGSLNSGGTNVDLMNYGQGLAGQTYNNYVSNLLPFLGYSTSNAGGAGNIYTGLGAGLNQNYNAAAGNLAGLDWMKNTNVGNANANAILANNQASSNAWNAIGQGVGMAAQFLPMLSDRRAKDDIEPVGELYDGTNIYRYRYKGDATPRIGVMAQEVEKTNPDAVIDVGGVKMVDYGKATEYAAMLAPFLKEAA